MEIFLLLEPFFKYFNGNVRKKEQREESGRKDVETGWRGNN